MGARWIYGPVKPGSVPLGTRVNKEGRVFFFEIERELLGQERDGGPASDKGKEREDA